MDLRAESTREAPNLADYTVLVPIDAFVSARSPRGNLDVQGLSGDVVLEAISGSVKVADLRRAYLDGRTLSSPIALTNISDSHLDVHSITAMSI